MVAILIGYVVTRGFGVACFAPHIDEVNATQYAQSIATDWEQNKYISLDGRMYGDYKDPLQYWITSLTVDLVGNPIVGVRLWSALFGLVGLIFTIRLVTRVWSREAGLVAGALIVFSEHYFYFDSIALAEVCVYGIGAAYLYYSYDSIARDRVHLPPSLLATAALSAMLLTKPSGQVWVALACLLPLLHIAVTEDSAAARWQLLRRRGLIVYAGVVAPFLVAQYVIHPLVVPSRFDAVRASSEGGLVATAKSLWSWPVGVWIQNADFYCDKVLSADSELWVMGAALSCILAGVIAARTGRLAVYLLVASAWVVSWLPMVIMMKVRYPRHFGMGLYFWYALAAIAIVTLVARIPGRALRTATAALLIALALAARAPSYLDVARWEQHEYAHVESVGWANGAGVMALIDHISRLEPGVLFYDPQWGHPGTTIQVFAASRYPRMQLYAATNDLPQHVEHAAAAGRRVYVALDSGRPDWKPFVDYLTPRARGEVVHFEKRFREKELRQTRLTLYTLN